MANVFFNIPVPTNNGEGTAVDVSSMGKQKSFVIGGSFRCTVNIEYTTNAPGDDQWAPLATFHQSGNITIDVACLYLRAVVSDYVSGAPNLDVGGNDAGTTYVPLLADSVAVDCSELPAFKTVCVSPGWLGTVEVSEDGNSWAQIMSFQAGAARGQSRTFVAQYARIVPTGLLLPVILCAANDSSAEAVPSNLYSQQSYEWIDDWLSPSQSLIQSGGWDSIPIGSIYSLTLGGPGTQWSSTSDTGRLGIGYMRVQNAAATAFVRIASQSGARPAMFTLAEYEAVVGVDALGTLAEAFWVDIGIFSLTEPDRVVFRYDQSNSQGGNPGNLDNWICATVNSSGDTQEILDGSGGLPDVPVVPVFFPNTGILRFLIKLYADRAEFYVNGVLATTITENLPDSTAPLGVGIGILKTNGNTEFKGLYVDYTRAFIQLAEPRVP